MKKFFLPVAIMLLAIGSHASTVSLSDAQNVALNFFKVTAAPNAAMTATLKYTKTESNNTVDFYVFDISPAVGFVIVAGDDNMIPILGYSTESSFHTNFKHTGLNHWVSQTARNIQLALQHNATADVRIQNQWSAYRQGLNPLVQRSGAVSPLCTTTWDQENDISNPPPFIYNLFCPYYAADTQRALTGCVATAMAQIMKFWNYPAQGAESYTYTDNTQNGYSNNYGTLSSDFSTHTYQWTSMPTVLTNATTSAQDSAVDLLMYDCAISVGMDFGDDNQDGSGAEGLLSLELSSVQDSICSQYALPKYFGYDPDTIRGVIRSDYADSVWIGVIKHEMDMGRPVLYEGDDATQGGHAWVCDGYDASNKFHMNWGWAGFSDGYYAITDFTTPGNFNPVQDEDALIGIMPKRSAHVSGIAGLSDELSFNIYPNPAHSFVVIQTTESVSGATWAVKNMMGQHMSEGNVQGMQTQVNIAGLASGVYFVEIQAAEKTSIKKLIVSK